MKKIIVCFNYEKEKPDGKFLELLRKEKRLLWVIDDAELNEKTKGGNQNG